MILSYTDYLKTPPVVIRGVVADAGTGEPVNGVSVYLLPGKDVSVTDCNGAFSLTSWHPMPVSVIVSHRLYTAAKFHVISAGEPLLFRIKTL